MEITGCITHIHDFGARVKIDQQGIEGRIYNENLSWDPRSTARELLKKGDKIETEVLRIDVSKQLILLGHKQTQPDPWDEVPEKYSVGSVVRGQIVDLTDFGAFVEIEKGVEGLIRISELTDQEIEKPEEVVSIDEELDVKVISISPKDRKIRLSIKAITAENLTAITYNGEKELPQVVEPDILFACSAMGWKTLRGYIQIREDVKRQSLSPIKSRKKTLKVLDSFLTSAREKKVSSFAVTRAGHELYGTIENFDSDKIEMQVSREMVTIYRQGLIEFTTMETHQGKVTEFKNNTRQGLIQSSGLPRIFVSISDVCGENTLSTGQSVEFEICQTLRGLEARNVIIIQN
ncbi:S1 RNA-binding domain-containing protein [Candidatus Poribacteria bacterium]|nr:S1 RNA-binding domain-containing protein [Candidatus Poribacteria bacterium]